MTPERKAYLMEHTGREATKRHLIGGYKHELKKYKAVCSSYNLKALGRKSFGYRIHIVQTKETKLIINALRHELARLKGMDGVVVPRMAYIGFYGDKGGLCKCDKYITDNYTYCPECGRRILWEKVK